MITLRHGQIQQFAEERLLTEATEEDVEIVGEVGAIRQEQQEKVNTEKLLERISEYEEKMIRVIKLKDRQLSRAQFSRDSLQLECRRRIKGVKAEASRKVETILQEVKQLKVETARQTEEKLEEIRDLRRKLEDTDSVHSGLETLVGQLQELLENRSEIFSCF